MIQSCMTCYHKPLFKEKIDHTRVFCGKSCQLVHYDIIDYPVKEDLWSKLQRDVSIRDLWRICNANEFIASQCNDERFKRGYVKVNRDQVQFFVEESLTYKRFDMVKAWIIPYLEMTPQYPNRHGLSMWAKKHKQQYLLDHLSS